MKTFISYAMALAGMGVVVAAVLSTFVGNVKYMYARALVINMLRTNPYQFIALARKPNGTFMDGIAAALQAGATTKSRDPKIVKSATLPTYDAAGMAVGQKYAKLVLKAKMGLMLVGMSLLLSIFGGTFPIGVFVIALLTGGALVFLLSRKAAAEGDVIRGRVEVLPEVDRCLVDGRFVKQ